MVNISNFFLFNKRNEDKLISKISSGFLSILEINVENEIYLLSCINKEHLNFQDILDYLIVVPKSLDLLIYSSKNYIPSLALSIYHCKTTYESIEQFFIELSYLLETFILEQRKNPFFLVKPFGTFEDIYEGIYYWIIGYNKESKHVFIINPWYFSIMSVDIELFFLTSDSKENLENLGMSYLSFNKVTNNV